MDISRLKLIKQERYFFALLLIIIMFVIAQITQQDSVIFPEALAIITGTWVSNHQPWNTNKRRIFLLTAIASIVGVAIVKFLTISLFFQVLLAFILMSFLLGIMRTDFVPIFAACILPIYLKTTSWTYSISVSVMALTIIIGQWIMEKRHIKSKNKFVKNNFNIKIELNKWLKLLFVFILLSIIPLVSKNIFLLAPPLIVTLVELSNSKSKARQKPLNILFIFSCAAIIGSMSKFILNGYFSCPLIICVIFSCLLLFMLFDYTKIYFPPAGAILLLPMLLPLSSLKTFPLEVIIGTIFIIPIGIFIFNDNGIQEKI